MRSARMTAGSATVRARLLRPGVVALLAALAVEFADELLDGTKSAAMPLIRHDLALSYVQIGLLTAVPLIVGSTVELPVGIMSGIGRRRRWFIIGGGVVFAGTVLAAGLAHSFGVLLVALTAFFPASGAFVSLTQAALMDAAPDQQALHMARWTLAGSVGALAGPLLLAAVLAAGGTWRLTFVLVAIVAAAALAAIAWTSRDQVRQRHETTETADTRAACAGPGGPPHAPPRACADSGGRPPATPRGSGAERAAETGWPGWRAAAATTRRSGAVRWLALLQVSDLLLDVLTAFLAVYLVAVARVSPAVAALGVAVRLGAGLAGDAILVRLLTRLDGRLVLRASGPAALLLFPAFLLVPGIGPKVVVLGALTLATAPWYPVLQAELYGSLPGSSGLAVSLTSAAGLVGGLGPLAVGLLAEHFGLGWAMASLCVAPAAMLAVPRGNGLAAGQARSTKIENRE